MLQVPNLAPLHFRRWSRWWMRDASARREGAIVLLTTLAVRSPNISAVRAIVCQLSIWHVTGSSIAGLAPHRRQTLISYQRVIADIERLFGAIRDSGPTAHPEGLRWVRKLARLALMRTIRKATPTLPL